MKLLGSIDVNLGFFDTSEIKEKEKYVSTNFDRSKISGRVEIAAMLYKVRNS